MDTEILRFLFSLGLLLSRVGSLGKEKKRHLCVHVWELRPCLGGPLAADAWTVGVVLWIMRSLCDDVAFSTCFFFFLSAFYLVRRWQLRWPGSLSAIGSLRVHGRIYDSSPLRLRFSYYISWIIREILTIEMVGRKVKRSVLRAGPGRAHL